MNSGSVPSLDGPRLPAGVGDDVREVDDMDEDSAMARLLGALTVATMLAARGEIAGMPPPRSGLMGDPVGTVVASAA